MPLGMKAGFYLLTQKTANATTQTGIDLQAAFIVVGSPVWVVAPEVPLVVVLSE